MLTKQELQLGLSQFTTIDGWYQHCLHQFVFTDGVKWLCDRTQCSGLLTAIAYCQFRIKLQYRSLELFQIWHLTCSEDGSGVLTCKTPGTSKVIVCKELDSVDRSLDDLTLWLVNGMLLLPNEHRSPCVLQ
ncbi:DUF6876 family protein [Leptodesmis sp.]|uniref:DUF6876 family protein n=1 Tax=Leptodesmis sp. TaxID=3100501 RepID=UPI00405352E7